VDKVLEILLAVKRDPRQLPEKSIWALQHFLSAYYTRIRMENLDSTINSLFRSFETWLGDHFGVMVQSQSIYGVIDSYSDGPEDGLNNFFVLFEQFQNNREATTNHGEETVPVQDIPKKDICEILRLIRRRPELYVGYPHFAGVHAYLAGHERAGEDLGLSKTADEKLYDDFKQWVEGSEREQYPNRKPRPWFKVVRFYSFHDCGLGRTSAYSVFFNFLDKFAKTRGCPGLFEISP